MVGLPLSHMAGTVHNACPHPAAASALSPEAVWSTLIPEAQWAVFLAATSAVESTGAPYLLGGALALATYTAHWRDTKDIDLIVRPEHRQRIIGALRDAGFEDYFARESYDRSWIFRGFKNGVLCDIIWDLPNHRVPIDDPWFERAETVTLSGRGYAVAPAEELIRAKLYVMQRERCDWVDSLNVLAAAAEQINWHWLVQRMGRDRPLLHAALALFNWMCPGRARAIPAWLRREFALPEFDREDEAATEERRVRLFDSRPWFAPHQPTDRPLER